jgi:hypothetical protein
LPRELTYFAARILRRPGTRNGEVSHWSHCVPLSHKKINHVEVTKGYVGMVAGVWWSGALLLLVLAQTLEQTSAITTRGLWRNFAALTAGGDEKVERNYQSKHGSVVLQDGEYKFVSGSVIDGETTLCTVRLNSSMRCKLTDVTRFCRRCCKRVVYRWTPDEVRLWSVPRDHVQGLC